MRKRIYELIQIFILFFMVNTSYSEEKISITDFGYMEGQQQNVIPSIIKALEYAKNKTNVTLTFPKARYDFWITKFNNTESNIGFNLNGMHNLVIDGGGSEFIFHGKMQIAKIDSCSNISFRNFSVDWDRPFISQAEIVNATDDYLDVKIDRKKYPFVIERDTIFFTGEGWKLPVMNTYNNLFDPIQREIVYKTWDNPLGPIFSQPAEELSNGNIRFHGKPAMKPEPKSIVSLFHLRYAIVGFEIFNCKDVLLKDLKIYHALSHGVLGIRSENITMYNASMVVNDEKERVFSIIADASHFINCKGTIKIENCAHTGQGDDFINVHGTNVKIQSKIDEFTLIVSERGGFNSPDDEIWFVDFKSAQRKDSAQIKSIKPLLDNGKIKSYEISFKNRLPESVAINDFIENKTWTSELEIRNCKILKRHRARGILVTTPKKALIENNYFNTAGTAILIEGDLDYWFESGSHKNLIIRNNIFDNCLTSGNANGSRGEWGEAIITITPSHKPKTENELPYHNNIQIINNQFMVFDAPLLRARSVNNLIFSNNKIIKTYKYTPYTWQKSAFLFDGCRNVKINNNEFDENFQTRDVLIEHMKSNDVQLAKDQKLKLGKVQNLNTIHSW